MIGLVKDGAPITYGIYWKKDKKDRTPNRKLRWPRLTVCIAMMIKIDKISAIVFTADRLVSSSGVIADFDKGEGKIDKLYPYMYVMASGYAPFADEIIIKTQKELSNSDENLTVEEAVNKLSLECKSKYEAGIEEIRKPIFSRYNLTTDEFKYKSNVMSDLIVRDVVDSLNRAEYIFNQDYPRADFLVVGVDTSPHIYVVDQLGKITFYDHIGFAAIGSGANLALPEITRLEEYNPNTSAIRGIIAVYNAKKTAERTGTVGTTTDLRLLGKRHDTNQIFIMGAKEGLITQLDKNINGIIEYEKSQTQNTMMALIKGDVLDLFSVETDNPSMESVRTKSNNN
jgi:hypothetical protein